MDNDHDRVVRYVAATRFPFPDQTDWPSDYVTITNTSEQKRGIATTCGVRYPDIVVVNGDGEICEIGEVETEVGAHLLAKWSLYSYACRRNSATGVGQFFVYVLAGMEGRTQQLLEENHISYAGVRNYVIDLDGRIRIIPIVTLGDPKDHR